MEVQNPETIKRNRNIVKGLIINSKFSLTISRDHDINDKTKQDHYYGYAYDVKTVMNKSDILNFYNYLKSNRTYLKSYGISRVLLGTEQPHVHISFNPDKANSNGSVYFGYELLNKQTGNIQAVVDIPDMAKIYSMYTDTNIYKDGKDNKHEPFKLFDFSFVSPIISKYKFYIAGAAGIILLPYIYKYFKKFKG
jgi:hypothetical protein